MKTVYIIIYNLLIVVIIASCNQISQNEVVQSTVKSGWRSVYQNDENGNRVAGSLDSLVSGIRNGYDVRVGWGWKKEVADSVLSVEHVAQPLFLTIIQQKNVSVVIDAHPLLQSYIDVDNQKFGEGGHIWQCVLTTQGTFNAQVHDRSTGELIKDWPQKHKMTWFLEYPNHRPVNNNPLFD